MENFFLAHYEEFKDKFGHVDTEGYLKQMMYGKMDAAVKAKDDGIMLEAVEYCNLMEDYQTSTKLIFLSMYYKQVENEKAFAEQLDQLAADYAEETHYTINGAAWDVYADGGADWLVKKALVWMQPVVKAYPKNYQYLDTYAALLYRDQQYDLASRWAQLAIDQGTAQGEGLRRER